MQQVQEVFLVDVMSAVCDAMKVPIASAPTTFYKINFNPGRNAQIMEKLRRMEDGDLKDEKYPLVAAVMPIPERNGSGFLEVTFPRIVIAYLTKSGDSTEYVKEKYDSGGVFKDILRPCLRQFIEKFAWSTYTNQGDPDAYEYTAQESPCQQPIGEGLTDYVDIIEILNLKATIFSQIKTC